MTIRQIDCIPAQAAPEINASAGLRRSWTGVSGPKTKCAAEAKLESKLEALEQHLKSVLGKLPVAKTWRRETVTYQAEFVSHDGALWQATKDTAQSPGSPDRVCVARAGHDAVTPTVRGTFDTREQYLQLDIVVSDGAAWIACRDNPGICPGGHGKTGRPGERGPRGHKGEKGEPGIVRRGGSTARCTDCGTPK
jgi:hypothetical protein